MDQTKDSPSVSAPSLVSVFVTLLVSSGAISIVGPLTGQLYWRGYLSAFGLSAEEFPAADADARSYAYMVIVEVVGRIWESLFSWIGIIAVGIVLIVTITVAIQTSFVKKLGRKVRLKLRMLSTSETPIGLVSQVATVSVFSLLAFAFIVYLATVATLVLVAPAGAQERGREDGLQRLKTMTDTASSRKRCPTFSIEGVTFTCPHTIAYGKDEIAIFDDGRIFRAARTTARHTSPVPSATQSPIE